MVLNKLNRQNAFKFFHVSQKPSSKILRSYLASPARIQTYNGRKRIFIEPYVTASADGFRMQQYETRKQPHPATRGAKSTTTTRSNSRGFKQSSVRARELANNLKLPCFDANKLLLPLPAQ